MRLSVKAARIDKTIYSISAPTVASVQVCNVCNADLISSQAASSLTNPGICFIGLAKI